MAIEVQTLQATVVQLQQRLADAEAAQKEAEERLRLSNDELEFRVRARTAQLEEAQRPPAGQAGRYTETWAGLSGPNGSPTQPAHRSTSSSPAAAAMASSCSGVA